MASHGKRTYLLISFFVIVIFLFIKCTDLQQNAIKNQCPTITAMADTSVSVNDSFDVYLNTKDAGSADLKFIWDIKELGIHDTLQDSILTIAFKTVGNFKIVVTAINQQNLVSEPDTIQIKVYAKPPMIKMVTVDSSYAVSDTIIFSVLSSDSDGVVKGFLWSLNGINYDTTKVPEYKYVCSPDSFGQKTLYSKAYDDDGLYSNTVTFCFKINQCKPTAIAMNDTSVFVNDSVILHASGLDSNGTIEKYLWSFNKTQWDTTTDSLKTIVWPITNYGKKIVYIKVVDDDAIVSSIDSAIIIVHLMAPAIKAKADTLVEINDTVHLHASATDSNGTVMKFVWSVDGKIFDTTTTGTFKTFWPLSSYGQKSEFVKALENEGVLKKNDSIFKAVTAVYAIDDDGISSNTAYIIVLFKAPKKTVLSEGFEGDLSQWQSEYLLDPNVPAWSQMHITTAAAHSRAHSITGDSNATALCGIITPAIVSGIVGLQFFIMAKSKEHINFSVQMGKDAGSSGGLHSKFGIGFDKSDSIMSMLYNPNSTTGNLDENIMLQPIEPNYWYKCVVEADFKTDSVTYSVDDVKIRSVNYKMKETFGIDRVLIIRGRNGDWGTNGLDGAKPYYIDDILFYTR